MKKISFKVAAVAGMLCVSYGVSAQAPAPGWFVQANEETGLVIDEGLQVLPCAVDINNDDYPDLVSLYFPPGGNYFSVRKPFTVHLNIQNPDSNDPKVRKFIDITDRSGIHNIPGDTGYHANCYTLADFNNDGNVDIITGNFYGNASIYQYPQDRCQVFLGDGQGNFTYKANHGLAAIGLRNIRMLTALDYDRDGNLDLFIATFYQSSHTGILDHGYLMKGNGDGTFSDMTDISGLSAYYEAMYGSSSTDYNDDCLPDIFTAPYCRSAGMVLKNQGNGTFVDMAAALGYDLERTGAGQRSCTFSVIPEDVNNDGHVDLFFTVVHGGNAPGQFRSTIGFNQGPDHDYAFTINESVLPVSPPASGHRGDYDGSFIDFDNDGLKDLVMVQGTYMPATDRTYFWQQQPDHTFKDVTGDLGLLVPELKSTGAVDVFDYDLDGDDDILIGGQSSGALQLWKNTIGQDKNYISVRPLPMADRGINRSGIGTRVYVYYGGKMQMKEVLAGRGQHTGQQPFILNFGLGDAQKVDSVVIRWPDAACSHKVVHNPPINKRLVVNSFPTGMEDVAPDPVEVKVFPNPTSRYIIIQHPELNDYVVETRVTDIAGRTLRIKKSASDGDKWIFDLDAQPSGVYFIHLKLNDGEQTSFKITRNK